MRALSKTIPARLPAIVLDRKTRESNGPCGATDTTGHAPGYLFYPDGLDPAVFCDGKSAAGR